MFEQELLNSSDFVLNEILEQGSIVANFISGIFIIGLEERNEFFVGKEISDKAEKVIIKKFKMEQTLKISFVEWL